VKYWSLFLYKAMLRRESQFLCSSQPQANYCESFGGDRVHLPNQKSLLEALRHIGQQANLNEFPASEELSLGNLLV